MVHLMMLQKDLLRPLPAIGNSFYGVLLPFSGAFTMCRSLANPSVYKLIMYVELETHLSKYNLV